MRERSHLYTLMAKKEEAKKASAVKELKRLHDAHAQAEMLSERLREILDDRKVTGQVLAAQLRSAASLTTKIAAEAAVQNKKKDDLAEALDQRRTEFARQDYKAKYLLEAARKARMEEAEERQQRADAARPVPRR